ncbi:MAG TPA: hypothetical protein VGS10_05765 [Terracidiphilus sp.]|nr:hypothetical protein [Terracidiphilus sp.]
MRLPQGLPEAYPAVTMTKRYAVPVADRISDTPTVAKRYKMPRYCVEVLRELAPEYGSQGRAIQVGAELLVRVKQHPIKPSPSLKAGRENPEEQVGMTYTLVPRTIEIIDHLVERYDTRGHVFEALVTMLARKYVTD